MYKTKLKNIYIRFLARNPFFSTPLCVSGLGTLTLFCALRFCRKEGGRIRVSRCCPGSSQTHHLCLVACQIAFTLLLAPLLSSEFMPCALTPAYGVTSICRFVQAVTALSIVPTVDRSSPLLSLGLLAVLFGLLSISFCHPSRHIASAFPHVNRRYFSALHPVFQQLVPTAAVYCYTPLPLVVLRYAPLMVFVEGGGVEPPPRLAVLPALSTFPLGQPSFAVVPCAYPQGPSFVYCPAIPSRHPATTPVALAAVVFFVFTSPFSSPFMIILLILCFG